jgi:hypothetical protein
VRRSPRLAQGVWWASGSWGSSTGEAQQSMPLKGDDDTTLCACVNVPACTYILILCRCAPYGGIKQERNTYFACVCHHYSTPCKVPSSILEPCSDVVFSTASPWRPPLLGQVQAGCQGSTLQLGTWRQWGQHWLRHCWTTGMTMVRP